MLEKFITNLKNSLPGSNGKKSDDEENEDDSEIDAAAERKASEDDDGKKKQISMIIRVVVILGLAYFALDEFVLKESTPEPTVDELMAKAAAKKKKKAVIKEEVAAPVADTASIPAPETPNPEETTNEVPPIENVNVLPKEETQVAATPTAPAEEVVASKQIETNVDQKIDQLIDKVDQEAGISNGATEEIKIPSQPEPKAATGNALEDMASKIVEEVTETSPPQYDQLGRGLVYNCKDKYWACVDKPAYVTCNKNMKWNKSKGKPMECAVQAIYNSEEDCGKIQKYNVSTNLATDFCAN